MDSKILAVAVLVLALGVRGQELLQDPGFEVDGAPAWFSWGFNMTSTSTDTHSGSKALICSGRTANWQGPGQEPPLKLGGRYRFTSWVKFLNNKPGVLFQGIRLSGSFHWKDEDKTDYLDFAQHAMARAEDGWISVAGDFSAPIRPWTSGRLYFQGPDPGVDFIVDDASLQEVTEDKGWKAKAKASVEAIRKSNVTFNVVVPHAFDPHQVTVEVQHKRHLFGWGSLVDDAAITSPDFKEYQNLFYHFFNWATVGTFKWGYAKGTPDNPDYSFAIKSMNEVRKNGLKVRGHNMFWGVPGIVPDWVKQLDATQLKQTLATRVQFMTNITYGKLDHWDINNELLHGQYWEEITGDPDYSMHLYDMVHAADPKPKLFLNEYDVLAVGAVTDSYVSQAKSFQKRNAALHALGLQSHFRDSIPPDPTLLKLRLDKLATVGLPLWITELTLHYPDERQRADWMEDILLTYFAHPAVEGVIFWDWWDRSGNPHSMLVDGYNYQINEVGQRYLRLIKNDWSTNVTHTLADGHTFSVRGFQGDYDVVVRYQGKPLKYQQFHLGTKDVSVNIQVRPQDHEIMLPTTVDPFIHLSHPGHVTHTGANVMGHASSSSADVTLTCVTRWSAESAVGDDKSVSVVCGDDEVLTGCSSFLKNNEWFRDGEKMETLNGKVSCTAVNGWRSTGPVRAAARCCKVKGLSCTYRSAGPSGTGINDKAESDCSNQELPTGCGSYTWVSSMDGAFPVNNSCAAQNDGTEFGVYSYAACCQAPGLKCEVKSSQPSDLPLGSKATVTCDPGYAMTGCNVYSEYGNTAGAFADDTPGQPSVCTAVNGADKYGGEEGVKAIAVCCKVN